MRRANFITKSGDAARSEPVLLLLRQTPVLKTSCRRYYLRLRSQAKVPGFTWTHCTKRRGEGGITKYIFISATSCVCDATFSEAASQRNYLKNKFYRQMIHWYWRCVIQMNMSLGVFAIISPSASLGDSKPLPHIC